MADNHVDFVFGAKVADLLSGVSQVKHAIEGLRSPVDSFISDLRGIGEAVGLAFAVEKLSEFTNKMAEIGEHAVNMGIALGTTAEQFQQLNEAMSLVGASGDALPRALRTLSRAAETAGINHIGDAFRALDIDAKKFAETLRTDPVAALKELAEAMVRTGNTSVQGPAGWILGRSGNADLYAFFSRGAKGIDELLAKAKELGAPSNAMLENLAHLKEQINGAAAAMTNFGLAVGNFLSGPGGRYIEWLTEAYERGTRLFSPGHGLPQPGPGAEGRGIFGNLPDIVGNATEWEKLKLQDFRQRESGGNYAAENKDSSASGAYQIIDETWRRWASAVGIDTRKYPRAKDAVDAMQDAAALHGFRAEGDAPWKASAGRSRLPQAVSLPEVSVEATAVAAKNREQIDTAEIKKNLEEEKKAITEKFKMDEAALDVQIQQEKYHDDTREGLQQKKLALALKHTQDIVDAEERANKASAGVVTGEGPNKPETERLQIKKQTVALEQQIDAERANRAISAAQTQIKVLDQQEQADLKATQHRVELNQLTFEQAAENEKKIVEEHRKAVDAILADEMRLAGPREGVAQEVSNRQVELAQRTKDRIKDINDKLESENYKTWKSIGDNIASAMASSIVGVLKGTETIGQAFANLASSLGEHLLNKGLTKGFDALSGSLFSGIGGSGLGSLAGSIFGPIGSIFGGLFGGLFGKSAAGGWQVPSFANGGIPAMLHGGEMVLPKHLSDGVQNAIAGGGFGGGGLTMNFHGPSDGASIKRWVGDTLRQNPNYVSDLFRRNAITPRNS